MDDTTRLIVFGVLFVPAVSLAIAGTITHQKMIDEVNRKRPTDAQFSYVGGDIEKPMRVRREYSRLYPNGNLRRRFNLCVAGMMFLGMGAVAVLFTFV